jgi:hypothetical protein
MRISSFTVYGYSNGNIIVDMDNDTHLTFNLTDSEAAALRSVAQDIVERRQVKFAMQVTAPFVALADFSEA